MFKNSSGLRDVSQRKKEKEKNPESMLSITVEWKSFPVRTEMCSGGGDGPALVSHAHRSVCEHSLWAATAAPLRKASGEVGSPEWLRNLALSI